MRIEPGVRIDPPEGYGFYAIVNLIDEDSRILKVTCHNERGDQWDEDWNLGHTQVGLGPSHGRLTPFYTLSKPKPTFAAIVEYVKKRAATRGGTVGDTYTEEAVRNIVEKTLEVLSHEYNTAVGQAWK